jgi:hypothetical protein
MSVAGVCRPQCWHRAEAEAVYASCAWKRLSCTRGTATLSPHPAKPRPCRGLCPKPQAAPT